MCVLRNVVVECNAIQINNGDWHANYGTFTPLSSSLSPPPPSPPVSRDNILLHRVRRNAHMSRARVDGESSGLLIEKKIITKRTVNVSRLWSEPKIVCHPFTFDARSDRLYVYKLLRLLSLDNNGDINIG